MTIVAYTTTKTSRAAGAAEYFVLDHLEKGKLREAAQLGALEALADGHPRKRKCFALDAEGIARSVDIDRERRRIIEALLEADPS